MTLREFFLENFAGDLEYHPRRALIYLALGAAALCFWIFSSTAAKFTAMPLACALGSLTLLTKGIFLLRKSSVGLGLSQNDLFGAPAAAKRREVLPVSVQAAQVVQDFGTGPLLLWPFLIVGRGMESPWTHPPLQEVFLIGAAFFAAGWAARWFLSFETNSR